MRMRYSVFLGTALCFSLGLVGCQTMGKSTGAGFSYKNIPVADGKHSRR